MSVLAKPLNNAQIVRGVFLFILYKDEAIFKQVMMLYRFDKKLRLLMFNEIEKIEIAVRRAVMQIPADMIGNPFWLTDVSAFLDSSKFNETMRAISKEYSKSKEEFILHYKRTYLEPYPPSWILGELLTIGNVNAIYRNIKQNRIRKRIAKRFGLPINVFESWLTVIAVTRNACGHHARVCLTSASLSIFSMSYLPTMTCNPNSHGCSLGFPKLI